MNNPNDESKLQESQVINEVRTRLNNKVLQRARSQTTGSMMHLKRPDQNSFLRKHSQKSQRISMLASKMAEKQSLVGSNLQSQIMYKKSIDILQTSFMFDAKNRKRLRKEKEKRVDVLKIIKNQNQKDQILFIDQFTVTPQFKKLKIRVIDFDNKLDPEVGKLKRRIKEQQELIETNHERTVKFGQTPQRRVPKFRKDKKKQIPVADIDLDDNKDSLLKILNESQSPSPRPKIKVIQNSDQQEMMDSQEQKQLKNNLMSQIEDLANSQLQGIQKSNQNDNINPSGLNFSENKITSQNQMFLDSERKNDNLLDNSKQVKSITEEETVRSSNKIMELAKRMSQKDQKPISIEKIETGVDIEKLKNKFTPKQKEEIKLINRTGKLIYDDTKPKKDDEKKQKQDHNKQKNKQPNKPQQDIPEQQNISEEEPEQQDLPEEEPEQQNQPQDNYQPQDPQQQDTNNQDVSLDFLQNQATPIESRQKVAFNPLNTIREEQEDFYPTMVDFTNRRKSNQKTSDDLFKFQGNSDTIKDYESNSKNIDSEGKSKGSDVIKKDLQKILHGDKSQQKQSQNKNLKNNDQQFNMSDVSQINDSNVNSMNPDSLNFSKKLQPSELMNVSSQKNNNEEELRKSKTLQPQNHKFNYTIDETLSALEQSEIQREEQKKNQDLKNIQNRRKTLKDEDKLLFQKSQTSDDSYFDNIVSSESQIKENKDVKINIKRNSQNSDDDQIPQSKPNLQNLFNGNQSDQLLSQNKSNAITEVSQSVNSQVLFLQNKNYEDQKFENSFALSDDQSQYQPLKRKYAIPDTQNHAMNQIEIKKTLFVTGNCCFLFLVSSILWILLCKDLIKRANHISGVILQTDNLQQYHEIYTQFYNKYNDNRLKKIETQQIFEQNSIDEYTRFKKTLQEFINNQNSMNEDLFEIKKYLYNQKKAFSRRRILEEGGHKHQDQIVYDENNMKLRYKQQGAIYALKKLRMIKTKLGVLQKILHYIKLNKQVLGTIYQDILENVNELYENSFQLINYYGKFHQMTNKIQAFKEDVYNLNEKRMKRVLEQIEISHFEKISSRGQDFKLEQMNYYAPALVSYVPQIEFEEKTAVSLLCSVDIEVNNSELESLNKSFDMFLIKNNETSEDQDFLFFENKIKKKTQSFYFNQILEFPPGKNNLSLYAYLQNGNIDVKSVQIDCLKFIQYEEIPEYEFQLNFKLQ